ncbi:MAG TPA: ATP-binding protein [Rubrivivax sp.]
MAVVSIRARLILLVLSVLTPALAAALWVIDITYANERSAIERNLRDTTRALSLVVDRELARRDVIARVLTLSELLDRVDLPAFHEQARRATDGIEGAVLLRSAQGVLVDTRAPSSAIPLAAQARAGSSAPALFDLPTVTPLLPDAATQALQATVVRPVLRDRKALFNVEVTLLPQELQRIVAEQRLPAGWSSAIVDSRGTVVAHQPDGPSLLGRPITDTLRAQLSQRTEGFFETQSLQGLPTVAFFSTSASNWSYVIAVPEAEFGSSLTRSLIPLLWGIAAVASVAVLGALWVARGISGAVDSLRQAARELQGGAPVQARNVPIRELAEVNTTLADASRTLLQTKDELERQVASAVQRTREAEQRVSQSQRVEALGRLTGGVAHDFNNLLGVISNSTHVLQRLPAGDGRDNAFAAIQRAVDLGSRLTQHLLRFAGRQPVKPVPVDLAEFLPRSAELMKTVMGSSVRIECELEPGTQGVTVDPSEMELALINLALNARDAMSGRGTLRLRARNGSAEAAGQVLLSVSDTGEGIDPDVLERVFEPFFTTKPVGKGSGLGLSQVYGFCQQAGGAATIESRAGAGTTVTMVLPATSAEPAPTQPLPAPPAPASAGEERRLLLVEDNDDLGLVTEALLRSFGFQVTRVRSGDDALRALEADNSFDVVLTDVVMPGAVDGLQLARRLKERVPPLPVVLISGYNTSHAQRNFEVLPKPCPPDDLLAALQRALQ